MEISRSQITEDRPVFLISDAHVGSRDIQAEQIKEEKLKQFFSYICTVSPKPVLYIVGDLFDFWFEYRYAIPAIYQKLLSYLVTLVDNGVQIRYITGNHDFWGRRFFQRYLNIDLYHGMHSISAQGKKLFLFHGDGILKEDRGYRILKRIIQNPLIIYMYQWLHPDIGIPIARWASAMSRNHYGVDPELEKIHDEQYFQYAVEVIRKGYDYVFMGHTHRPMHITNGRKGYINLGDWIRHFTFARIREGQIRLFYWKGGDTEQPFEEYRKEEMEFY